MGAGKKVAKCFLIVAFCGSVLLVIRTSGGVSNLSFGAILFSLMGVLASIGVLMGRGAASRSGVNRFWRKKSYIAAMILGGLLASLVIVMSHNGNHLR